jgi:hypothetical protein
MFQWFLLNYRDSSGSVRSEAIWGIRQGEYMQVRNIPFFHPYVALDDLVKISRINDFLQYNGIFKRSDKRDIKVYTEGSKSMVKLMKHLQKVPCLYETYTRDETCIFSISLREKTEYFKLIRHLGKAEQKEKLFFETTDKHLPDNKVDDVIDILEGNDESTQSRFLIVTGILARLQFEGWDLDENEGSVPSTIFRRGKEFLVTEIITTHFASIDELKSGCKLLES